MSARTAAAASRHGRSGPRSSGGPACAPRRNRHRISACISSTAMTTSRCTAHGSGIFRRKRGKDSRRAHQPSLPAKRSNPVFLLALDCSHGDVECQGTHSFFDCDPRFRPISAIWVCLPDQTHIRSAHEAAAPGFRLRRVGPRGRDHSSLRHLKPSNPSVRPPGSAEADRASADWLNLVVLLSCCDGCQDASSEARDYAAVLITAPSITTPCVTYFHNATSSLRASATMEPLRPRSPRALNHFASSDCG
jgi:hypothetical protein